MPSLTRKERLADRSIALCDSNNFFVSCERRRDPALRGRPVAVLSGNDGVVVARSNEVKDMGVPMAVPYFKVKELLKYHGAAVLSGDIPYYSAVSAQVMDELSRWTPEIEVYSIDESFLNLAVHSVDDPVEYCRRVRQSVWRRCNIPVSIGLASTKTLAKIASHTAKKDRNGPGVFWLDRSVREDSDFMSAISVGDIWGVGAATEKKLALCCGIRNAWALKNADDLMLKTRFSVNLLQTAWELRGFSAYPLRPEQQAPKSIQVSRTFAAPISEYDYLSRAVMYFVGSAARQLRLAGKTAGKLGVYIRTSRFTPEFYANGAEAQFDPPICTDGDLILASENLLKTIFKDGERYAKAGVTLTNFGDVSCGRQANLFEQEPNRRQITAEAVDRINKECGRIIMGPAKHFYSPPIKEDKHGLQNKTI